MSNKRWNVKITSFIVSVRFKTPHNLEFETHFFVSSIITKYVHKV